MATHEHGSFVGYENIPELSQDYVNIFLWERLWLMMLLQLWLM